MIIFTAGIEYPYEGSGYMRYFTTHELAQDWAEVLSKRHDCPIRDHTKGEGIESDITALTGDIVTGTLEIYVFITSLRVFDSLHSEDFLMRQGEISI